MSDELPTSVCRFGGMELSQVVNEALSAVADSAPVAAPDSSARWGGEWHCPADGVRMQEINGKVLCPACGRHLPGPILYQLIEFHVHQAAGTDNGCS
jgi:hypothetical protein